MIIPNYAGSILLRLKQETQELHHRLEATVDILNPTLELERYKALLERFYGFYLPVENRIAALKGFESLNLDPALRWKTPMLINDLADLEVQTKDLVELPLCTDLPELSNLAMALGCMYVLEGATLGGQVISRHLKKMPGLGGTRNLNFYNSYEDKVGPMWKAFCRALDTYVNAVQADATSLPVDAIIIEAANQTFQKLDGWLVGMKISNCGCSLDNNVFS